MKKGSLILIPVPIDPELSIAALPNSTVEAAKRLQEFIVERERTARRVLKQYQIETSQDDLIFHDIGKHSDSSMYSSYLSSCEEGKDIGLLSESGCPGVADPGAQIVALAHERNIEVIPLVGPSSILLALMASGMNGQSFAFNGYLPIDKGEKAKAIKQMSQLVLRQNQSQVIIETPFRVQSCMEDLAKNLDANLKISVAFNLGTQKQKIICKTVSDWRKFRFTDQKPLAVIVIGK